MRALPGGLRGSVVDFQRDLDILHRGEERDEIGLLKNKAEVLAAEGAQVHERTRSIQHGLAADGDLAGGRRIDQRDRGQQRGFARTARAEQRRRSRHARHASRRRGWPRLRCGRCHRLCVRCVTSTAGVVLSGGAFM